MALRTERRLLVDGVLVFCTKKTMRHNDKQQEHSFMIRTSQTLLLTRVCPLVQSTQSAKVDI